MKPYHIIGLFIIAALCLPVPALAGSFKAVPIKLFLDAGTQTTTLTVTNQGGEKVTVQLDAKQWSQDETGQDVYTDTRDIVFFPKIADIGKGEKRIVRVGYQGAKDPRREKTYRLFLQELPVTKPGEMALKFALRFGIPIFVKPRVEVSQWGLDDKLELAQESLKLKVKNTGSTHLMVGKIRASGVDESGAEVFSKEKAGWYALAGATKTFVLAVAREDCLKASAVTVDVEVDKTTRSARLAVDKAMCTPKPEAPKDGGKAGTAR